MSCWLLFSLHFLLQVAGTTSERRKVGLMRRSGGLRSGAHSQWLVGPKSKRKLTQYHTGEQIFKEIEALSKDCLVPMSTEWKVDKLEGNGKLFVARVGNEAAAKRVLLVANEHARELITAETALRFLTKACSGKVGEDILKQVRFTIVPIANEKGRKLVETGEEPCQRMTSPDEGGVDLNRNMDVDWGKGEKQDWGDRPFSTYQDRIIRDLADEEKPLAYVDLHTGAKSLMTSWGFKTSTDPDFGDQKRVLEMVQKKHCPDCVIGSNRLVIGYENPGEVIDHMYKIAKVKYSTLWEIYDGDSEDAEDSANSESDNKAIAKALGKMQADQVSLEQKTVLARRLRTMERVQDSSCLSIFNPPDAKYEDTVDNWSEAVFTLGDFVLNEVELDERSMLS